MPPRFHYGNNSESWIQFDASTRTHNALLILSFHQSTVESQILCKNSG